MLARAPTCGFCGARLLARPLSTIAASGHRPGVSQRARPQHAPRRTMFGIGEIIGVITNPSEVLRNLTESKKLLEQARQDIQENKERQQIPTSHTFSALPGFFPRPRELQALERALGSVPSFTVLFGASSAGKTALCRQVLSDDKFHCIHFDLRIAGFADLQSLYFSLATQMEGFFMALPEMMGKEFGWDAFEKESWAFKHDRLAIEARVEKGGFVKTSDVAHLMELFQSALLKYWQFEPMTEVERKRKEAEKEEKAQSKPNSAESNPKTTKSNRADPTERKMRRGAVPEEDLTKEADLLAARTVREQREKVESNGKIEAEDAEPDFPKPPPKKTPVFFLDEAHKLPALIQNEDAMKSLLDSMLVLTKQDRLCHVIHATSDPFYMHWLRQMNVMQHCQILSIGDTAKAEAQQFFEQRLLPHVPEKIRQPWFNFEEVYKVFGGKLAHISDYTTSEYINSDGKIRPIDSSHFLQAHALINLQLIHAQPRKEGEEAAGFEIYSSLKQASPHSAPSPFTSSASPTPSSAAFTTNDLLIVMSRLVAEKELGYFALCREFGAGAIDGMVKGRLMELRWTDTITEEREGEAEQRREKGMMGPLLVPTTPVVRYAMQIVLAEYEKELKEAQTSRTAKE